MITLANDTIDNKDIDRLIDWLRTYPRLTKGVITKEFEEKWAAWIGTKYSVFVNSGSSANLLMLYAIILSKTLKNKKVVVPGLCWATNLAPIIQLNLEPLLCDINLDTLSVDLSNLEEIFITEKPSVLLLVSILGLSPHMEEIVELCRKHQVILIEDNCESLGTKYNNIKLGNFGLMSSFSLYFGHHISTIEGGVICTSDKNLYKILLSIRSHGWDRDWNTAEQKCSRKNYGISDFDALYTFYYPGFNLRSTDLQAFIGLGQLEKLDTVCKLRNKSFIKFQEKIKNSFWKPKPIHKSFTSNFSYPVISPKKHEIIESLKINEIETRPLVCGSMAKQPFYTKKFKKINLEKCNVVDNFGIYVPNNQKLTENEINLIIDSINKVL